MNTGSEIAGSAFKIQNGPKFGTADRRIAAAREPRQRDLRVEQRRGDADLRVRGDELLLGLPDVRAPCHEVRRQARRQRGCGDLRVERAPALDRSRILSEQNIDEVLGLFDLALHLGDGLGRAVEQRLRLPQIEHTGHAALQPCAHQLDGLLARDHRAPRDRERQVERAQREVRLPDFADQRGHHRIACILARQHLGAGRFRRPPVPSPEIHLPREAETGLRQETVVRVRDRPVGAAVAGVRRADVAVHRREFARPLDRHLALRGENACGGNAHLVVLDERGAHQRLQIGIGEHAPPRELAEGRCAGRRGCGVGATIRRWHRDLRPDVIGTDRAPGGHAETMNNNTA